MFHPPSPTQFYRPEHQAVVLTTYTIHRVHLDPDFYIATCQHIGWYLD